MCKTILLSSTFSASKQQQQQQQQAEIEENRKFQSTDNSERSELASRLRKNSRDIIDHHTDKIDELMQNSMQDSLVLKRTAIFEKKVNTSEGGSSPVSGGSLLRAGSLNASSSSKLKYFKINK